MKTINLTVVFTVCMLFIVSGCGDGSTHKEIQQPNQPSTLNTDAPVINFSRDDTLEVMTWNLEHFAKNNDVTVDYLVTIFESLDVDLIALQEITNLTLFEKLVSKLPEYQGYTESLHYGGLTYLYKEKTIQPVDNYEIYTDDNDWRAFPRAPQVMQFIYKDQPLVIINNHFKCCGDSALNLSNEDDEETRRLKASTLLKEYVDAYLSDSKVIIVGDLNDELTDVMSDNIFQPFLEDTDNYLFVDMLIANTNSSHWSFPSYPSHIDHILITNELFDEFNHQASDIQTINIDELFFTSWFDYDANISDHRPVALKLKMNQ